MAQTNLGILNRQLFSPEVERTGLVPTCKKLKVSYGEHNYPQKTNKVTVRILRGVGNLRRFLRRRVPEPAVTGHVHPGVHTHTLLRPQWDKSAQ